MRLASVELINSDIRFASVTAKVGPMLTCKPVAPEATALARGGERTARAQGLGTGVGDFKAAATACTLTGTGKPPSGSLQ